MRRTIALAFVVLLAGSACRDDSAPTARVVPPLPVPTVMPPGDRVPTGDHLPPALAGCCAGDGTTLPCDRPAFDAIGALCAGDPRVAMDPGPRIRTTTRAGGSP